MRIQLPDVNVLIALHDATHQGHERAHQWFTNEGRLGWATCPLTENGFIRQITDVYLLGLCQQNGGTLVTLDAAITVTAIVSPDVDLIRRL